MKKLATLSIAGAVLALTVGGAVASADSMDSKVNIGFSSHTQNPNPGDGELTLQFVPKAFDFGRDNDVEQGTYAEITNKNFYAVVRDDRPTGSTTNTWKLTAAASELVDGSGNGAANLTTAFIEMDAASKGYDGSYNEPGAVTISAPATGAPTVQSAIKLTTNGASARVMQKATTDNDGWAAAELSNINLTVPSAHVEPNAQYAGEITWTLDDTI